MNLGKNPATPHLKALGLVMRWAGLLQAWDRDCTRAPLLPLGAQSSWNGKFFTVYWDVNSDLRVTNLGPWLNIGHVSWKKMKESFTSGLELNSMLKTFRSCSLLRKIVGETGREMKGARKKTALHHPDAYLVCNSMPGALTPGCWKDVLITWCRRPCLCPPPLYLKVPGVSQRTVSGARAACAAAEDAMEMKVTWDCQLKLQGALTKVKSHVIFFLATAEYS